MVLYWIFTTLECLEKQPALVLVKLNLVFSMMTILHQRGETPTISSYRIPIFTNLSNKTKHTKHLLKKIAQRGNVNNKNKNNMEYENSQFKSKEKFPTFKIECTDHYLKHFPHFSKTFSY